VAPNPGEGLKPLARIASGGETSRLMLALKNILARADEIPSLIFDEIDQGIGGRVGLVVGFKLWHLARNHQVFCVTQPAAAGGLRRRALPGAEAHRQEPHADPHRTAGSEPQLLELSQMLARWARAHPLAHELMQVARKMIKESRNALFPRLGRLPLPPQQPHGLLGRLESERPIQPRRIAFVLGYDHQGVPARAPRWRACQAS